MSKYWWVGDPFMKKKLEKKSHNAEKNWKGGPFGGFQHPFCRKTSKNWSGPFGENFFSGKKSHNAKKTERGEPLVSPGMVSCAGKQEKPFWFSSLGQIVQFGAILFCRTFVELFWSVQVVLKKQLTKSHDYSRLFSKEKCRLKFTKKSQLEDNHSKEILKKWFVQKTPIVYFL